LKLFRVHKLHEVLDFLTIYGEIFRKDFVVAKRYQRLLETVLDIRNQSLFHLVKEMGLTIEEVDKLTGPVIGRPKSATLEPLTWLD
jgi:3-hydroxyacyl-CoA dehydrogenase